MKPSRLATLPMAVFVSLLLSAPVSFGAENIKPPASAPVRPAPCNRPPDTQVVNNSGGTIYQVKVGKVVFEENLSYCTDGCSTGFIAVKAGDNRIAVKIAATSPWVDLGSSGTFKKCRHYAVNLKKKGTTLCAELFERKNTTPTFNDDTTKKKITQVCKSIAPVSGLIKPKSPAAE